MHRATPKKKPLSALDKRVPRNPKYADVRARIDSGLTMEKVRVVTTREYLRRRTETFARVSAAQLHELFTEYEDDVIEQGAASRAPSFDGPRIVTHEVEDRPEYERPYLILDVRSPQEFQECHILQGRNFPHQYLNQDKISADLLRYRNRDGHLIILYDEDERLSTATASQFVEKGYLNVYVLSGGLEAFSEDYPAYVEGQLPEAILSRREETHFHNGAVSPAAAAPQSSSSLALCDSLNRLSLSSLRTSRLQRQTRQDGDDARSDVTSLVSMPTGRLAATHPTLEGRAARGAGYHSSAASTARSIRGAGLSGAPSEAAAAASSLALRKALSRRRTSSISGRGGGNNNNMSTHSGISVADSIISRAQAKKGSF